VQAGQRFHAQDRDPIRMRDQPRESILTDSRQGPKIGSAEKAANVNIRCSS
jgi:hypothetical protein